MCSVAQTYNKGSECFIMTINNFLTLIPVWFPIITGFALFSRPIFEDRHIYVGVMTFSTAIITFIVSFITSEEYVPMKLKELASLLQVPRPEKEEFKEVIDKLISEGKVLYDGKSRIRAAGADMASGYFMGTAKGFGFVRIDGENEDIFIPPDKPLKKAL